MPDTHDQEQGEVTNIGSYDSALEGLLFDQGEHQTHIDIVAEPEGQGHVPTIPELFDIPR